MLQKSGASKPKTNLAVILERTGGSKRKEKQLQLSALLQKSQKIGEVRTDSLIKKDSMINLENLNKRQHKGAS